MTWSMTNPSLLILRAVSTGPSVANARAARSSGIAPTAPAGSCPAGAVVTPLRDDEAGAGDRGEHLLLVRVAVQGLVRPGLLEADEASRPRGVARLDRQHLR